MVVSLLPHAVIQALALTGIFHCGKMMNLAGSKMKWLSKLITTRFTRRSWISFYWSGSRRRKPEQSALPHCRALRRLLLDPP
jgi:hypothetical protein